MIACRHLYGYFCQAPLAWYWLILDISCSVLKSVHNYMHNSTHAIHLEEPKRQANLNKHGVDFTDAERVFAGPTFTFEDDREDYGEQRWVTLGLLGVQVVVIVHTETEEEIRVISMREADNNEQ